MQLYQHMQMEHLTHLSFDDAQVPSNRAKNARLESSCYTVHVLNSTRRSCTRCTIEQFFDDQFNSVIEGQRDWCSCLFLCDMTIEKTS